jgi:hypothetical protein
MDTNELILVSVDDHVIEPRGMFEAHIPAKYRDRAPRVLVDDRTGDEYWLFEDERAAYMGLNAVAGCPPEEYGLSPTRYEQMRSGCYDVHERVRDMNVNGVLASINFPSFPHFCGQLFARATDKDLAINVVRAYNDWHIDEWCGSYPDRFIPCAITPFWDPELMAEGCAAPLTRGATRSPSRRTRRSSASLVCTSTTGTRSGRRASTRARSSTCTSGRRRR